MTAGLCVAEFKPTLVKTDIFRSVKVGALYLILMTAGLCVAEFKPTLVKTDFFR
jgi:hypothetical protein